MADQLRALTAHKFGFKIAVAAATIGVIYGYDLGAIAGALLFITDDFDLSTKQTEWVATIVVAGSVLGALVGGRIANAIGRKPTMVVVAITYAVFAVLSGLAPSLTFLDIARFFLGVTIGISVVTAPIFVAESAPAAVRGGMIVMYQVATVTGIVIAYFVDFALAGSESWRLMLALSAVPSIGRPVPARAAARHAAVVRDEGPCEGGAGDAAAHRPGGRPRPRDRRDRGGPARRARRLARRDAARALRAGDAVRGRARVLHPDHRHQRGHLLQPDDLQGDGLHGELVAAAAAGDRPARLAGGDARLALDRGPAGPAARRCCSGSGRWSPRRCCWWSCSPPPT